MKIDALKSQRNKYRFLKPLGKILLNLFIAFIVIYGMYRSIRPFVTEDSVITFLTRHNQTPKWLPDEMELDVEGTEIYKQRKLHELYKVGELLPAKAKGILSSEGRHELLLQMKQANKIFNQLLTVRFLTMHNQTFIVGADVLSDFAADDEEVKTEHTIKHQEDAFDEVAIDDVVLRWSKEINQAASKYQISPALIAAVIEQESGGNPNSLSPVGAIGLMQLMPLTANGLGVNPYDPIQNIDGGAHYLSIQLKHFGDVRLALAAYNAGPGNVESGKYAQFLETRNYMERVPRLMEKYQQTLRAKK